jgi:hypothetical protein
LRRSVLLLSLAGAVALLAGGCGGSKKSSTSTTTPATTTAATTTTATTTTATTTTGAATTSASTTTTPAKPSGPPLTKAAYDRQMSVIGRGISESLNTLNTAGDAKSAAVALTKVQEDLRNAQKQLEAIAPPKPVAADHAKLTQAVGDFADDLGPVIVKLHKGNFAALDSVVSLPSFVAIQTYAGAIEKAGYQING